MLARLELIIKSESFRDKKFKCSTFDHEENEMENQTVIYKQKKSSARAYISPILPLLIAWLQLQKTDRKLETSMRL